MDMGFVSSKSSYPNMIKRLVNAYAGRPNLSGRASTESHRLLRGEVEKSNRLELLMHVNSIQCKNSCLLRKKLFVYMIQKKHRVVFISTYA